jgi:type III restriction enzyme
MEGRRTVGLLWEKKSGGKVLFLVVERTIDGKDMREQMIDKIGAN